MAATSLQGAFGIGVYSEHYGRVRLLPRNHHIHGLY